MIIMGFADKLRSKINKVSDTVQGAVDNAQSGFDPLPDETSKKYYEIAYGLLSSIYWEKEQEDFYHKKTKEIFYEKVHFNTIKNYIEYHSGEACDVEKLHSILNDYFDKSNNSEEFSRFSSIRDYSILRSNLQNKKIPSKKIENLVEINKELDRTQAYVCSRDAILDICFKDAINDIKAKFDNVLTIVEEYGESKFLDEGLGRIRKECNETLPSTLADSIIKKVFLDSFYSGNSIITKCSVNFFIHYAVVKHAEAFGLSDCFPHFSALSLKALHFEHYGNNKENYSPITDEECRDFVLNNKFYADALRSHPFDKDEYVNKFVAEIKEACNYISKYFFLRDLDYAVSEDAHFIDNICNLAWKKIAGIYTEQPEDYNSIANLFYSFAKKPQLRVFYEEADDEYDEDDYEEVDDDEYEEDEYNEVDDGFEEHEYEGEEIKL